MFITYSIREDREMSLEENDNSQNKLLIKIPKIPILVNLYELIIKLLWKSKCIRYLIHF